MYNINLAYSYTCEYFAGMILPFIRLKSHFLRLATYLILFSILTLLCGCPYVSSYKIDAEPQYLVEETLLGNWETIGVDEKGIKRSLQMNVSKKNDFEYDLIFIGYQLGIPYKNKPENDTLKATAFMSVVDDRKFLNILADKSYYIAMYEYENDEISLSFLCDHFTNRIIKSDDELRKSVSFHFKTRLFPLFDESFCLKGMARIK